MEIPWPWSYVASSIATLMAFAVFIIVAIVILAFLSERLEDGQSQQQQRELEQSSLGMHRFRVFISIITLSSTGVVLVWGFRWLGRQLLWFGLNQYHYELIHHRVWPNTFAELLYCLSVLIASTLWILPLWGAAMMLFWGWERGGRKVDGAFLAIFISSAFITIVAAFVVGCLETGWYGAFPPARDE